MTTATAIAAVSAVAAGLGANVDNPVAIADRNDTTVMYWDTIEALGLAGDVDGDTLSDGEIESLFSHSVKATLATQVLPSLDGSSKSASVMLDLFVSESKKALKGIENTERKAFGNEHELYRRVISDAGEKFVALLEGMVEAAPAFCQALELCYTTSVTMPGGQNAATVISKCLGTVRVTSAENRRYAKTAIESAGIVAPAVDD